MPSCQKLALDFNDDEAVWRAFESRKRLRELLGDPTPVSDEAADARDWGWAERQARPVRAIGIVLP